MTLDNEIFKRVSESDAVKSSTARHPLSVIISSDHFREMEEDVRNSMYMFWHMFFYTMQNDEMNDPESIIALETQAERVVIKKRKLRMYRSYEKPENVEYIFSDCDSAIKKIILSEDIKSRQQAEHWFYTCEYLPEPRSAFDCTGKLFSSGARYMQRESDKRWVIYHYISVDM